MADFIVPDGWPIDRHVDAHESNDRWGHATSLMLMEILLTRQSRAMSALEKLCPFSWMLMVCVNVAWMASLQQS